MNPHTIYITLLDGQCASYFIEDQSHKPLITPKYLTIQYDGRKYELLKDLDKQTIMLTNKSEFNTQIQQITQKYECLIPTFEEVWALTLTKLIENSLGQYAKYELGECKEIIFTISETYKHLQIYNTIIDLLNQLQSKYTQIIKYYNYEKAIENSLFRDYFVDCGGERYERKQESQIHSFIEIGFHVTMIYSIKVSFKRTGNIYIPISTAMIETKFVKIGIFDLLFELFGENPSVFIENLTILTYFSQTDRPNFKTEDDETIAISINEFYQTEFAKKIVNELSIIEDKLHPIDIKFASDLNLKFMVRDIMGYREGNGLHISSFYITGLNSIISNGLTKTYTNPIDPNKLIELHDFISFPLFQFKPIRTTRKNFEYDEIIQYFDELNIENDKLLSMKTKVQNECRKFIKENNIDNETAKLIREAIKQIDVISLGNGDKYYETWIKFKNNLI